MGLLGERDIGFMGFPFVCPRNGDVELMSQFRNYFFKKGTGWLSKE